jgi:hypothetical protein
MKRRTRFYSLTFAFASIVLTGVLTGCLNEETGAGGAFENGNQELESAGWMGAVDKVTDDARVYGWAVNPKASGEQIKVQAYVDGTPLNGKLIRSVFANSPRPDINESKKVTGDHGYSFSIQPEFKDDKTHTLRVYAVGPRGLMELDQSPQTFKFKNLVGTLDVITPAGRVQGWALANTLGEGHVKVRAYLDGDSSKGRLIRTVTANAPREDVNQALKVPGDHGFAFSIQDEFKDGKTHSLRVYAEGPGGLVEVGQSPMNFKFEKFQLGIRSVKTGTSDSIGETFVQVIDGQGNAHDATSNSQGLASFTLLKGIYQVQVTKEGFKAFQGEINLNHDYNDPNPDAPNSYFLARLDPQFPKRKGAVRLSGRTLSDDDGPFNALGATLFSAARLYKTDRAKLERHLETLSKNGFDYIRALGVVAWTGREIDWRWSDYRQVIEGVTDLAYDKYGIRVQWTIFGDAQIIIPNRTDQQRLVETFLDISRGREHKIIMFEVANEYYQNGFEGDEGINYLRSFARFLNERTPILVATSSANEECGEINEGGIADVGIMHFDRDIGGVDGMWAPVRQPWEYQCDGLPAGSNNEPIGPGSSVACDSDPMRMAMAAVTTYNSGLPFYVFHTRVGVGQATRCGLDGDQEIQEMPGIEAFKAMKTYMPPGSSSWPRYGHTSTGNPLLIFGDGAPLRTTSEGAQNGCMRNYASAKDDKFVAAPIGCRGTVKFEARRDVTFDVLHPITGSPLRHLDLKKGESFEIDGLDAYIMVGTMSGPSVTECSGSPLSILECHRSRYPDVMSHSDLINLLRGATRDFNRDGVAGGPFGLLRKLSGNNCEGYSCDVICSGQGSAQKQWDVMINEDIPTWGDPIEGAIRIDVCEPQ